MADKVGPLAPNAACARCGEAFHCGAADEVPCWCVLLPVEPTVLADLSERYVGCLCRRCLARHPGERRDP